MGREHAKPAGPRTGVEFSGMGSEVVGVGRGSGPLHTNCVVSRCTVSSPSGVQGPG